MPKGELNQQEILDGKIFAVLSYISILCIIPLALKKNNEFVLSHSKQGLVLFVVEVAVFVLSVIFPWILRLCLFVLGVLSLWGMIEAIRGNTIKLPLISKIADKIVI